MKNIIILASIVSLSLCLTYSMITIADRIKQKQPYPESMQRIDSMQGLTEDMKKHAIDRLNRMPNDSVEMIIKQAGF